MRARDALVRDQLTGRRLLMNKGLCRKTSADGAVCSGIKNPPAAGFPPPLSFPPPFEADDDDRGAPGVDKPALTAAHRHMKEKSGITSIPAINFNTDFIYFFLFFHI